MEVIIIDDGINEKFCDIQKLKNNLEVTECLKLEKRTNYNKYNSSHGSICAAIIKAYVSCIEFSSLKVLNEYNKKGTIEKLLVALEWCQTSSARVINLSLGTINVCMEDKIRKIINKLVRKRKIIIAAYSNSNKFSFPANYAGVIGVSAGKELCGKKYYYNNSSSCFSDFIASSRHIIHVGKKKIITDFGNSFAAPTITSIVCNIIKQQEDFGFLKLLDTLKKDKLSYHYCASDINFIETAVIVGNNIKNIDKTNIHIDKIYDSDILINWEKIFLNQESYVIITTEIIKGQLKSFKNFLENNANKIVGVVYCGIMLEEFVDLIHRTANVFFWDETCSSTYHNWISIKENRCEIPIIKVIGLNALIVAKELKEKLNSNGYNTLVISNFEKSYLYDAYYIAMAKYSDEILSANYAYKYNLDILIVVVDDWKNTDLILCSTQNEDSVLSQNGDKLYFEYKNQKSLDKIERKIISLFT